MPVYPYECDGCGHAFEAVQAMADRPRKKCPSCGRHRLRRVFTVPNVVVRYSPKTVGQAAEQNTRDLVGRVGRERAEAIIRHKVYGKKGKKLRLPKGATPVPRPAAAEVPWWRSGEVEGTGPRSEKPVDARRLKNPARYIRTGEKD